MDQSLLIAVLMGGPGSEREVSLTSGRAVLKALEEEGMNAVGVDVTDTTPQLPEGTALAFNAIHGTFGEDGGLQEYLEGLGVPYTGAGAASSRLAFDKVASKERFVEVGVPTPASEIVDVSGGVSAAADGIALRGEAAARGIQCGGAHRADAGGGAGCDGGCGPVRRRRFSSSSLWRGRS